MKKETQQHHPTWNLDFIRSSSWPPADYPVRVIRDALRRVGSTPKERLPALLEFVQREELGNQSTAADILGDREELNKAQALLLALWVTETPGPQRRQLNFALAHYPDIKKQFDLVNIVDFAGQVMEIASTLLDYGCYQFKLLDGLCCWADCGKSRSAPATLSFGGGEAYQQFMKESLLWQAFRLIADHSHLLQACAQCHKVFILPRRGGKFCSRKCTSKAGSAAYWSRLAPGEVRRQRRLTYLQRQKRLGKDEAVKHYLMLLVLKGEKEEAQWLRNQLKE